MGLVTRQIGPDAKGSKLTFADMDNNLYYLLNRHFGVKKNSEILCSGYTPIEKSHLRR